MRPSLGAILWCFAPQPLFCLCSRSPPVRLVGSLPYPLPHLDRHLSDSAALRVVALPPVPVSSPPHVGVGFYHTQIAGCGRAVAIGSAQSRRHLDEGFSAALRKAAP
eukprot:scaffold26248_cov53-Phaeocystis_antarctica.AAC.1